MMNRKKGGKGGGGQETIINLVILPFLLSPWSPSTSKNKKKKKKTATACGLMSMGEGEKIPKNKKEEEEEKKKKKPTEEGKKGAAKVSCANFVSYIMLPGSYLHSPSIHKSFFATTNGKRSVLQNHWARYH
eukprot:TRINITY_DN4134_c1_g5_i1.p1 TRINITY_DN4134_c1_g5~~TRINITY_DN4134_c1_g5_i1.p1  ORF type:complete len:131 (-),score=12.40 TRINITY_DN4134_c1_g5_i1:237-629(-)